MAQAACSLWPTLRGGGEYGTPGTVPDARKEAERVDDYLAAAEYLIAQKFTSPRHLAALRYSNAGCWS